MIFPKRLNAEQPHHVFVMGLLFYSRRRPTLPHSYPCSTIGPEGLNFRVRDGNGCDPLGIATEKSFIDTRIARLYDFFLSIAGVGFGFRFFCMFVDLYSAWGKEILPPDRFNNFMVKPHGRLVPVS